MNNYTILNVLSTLQENSHKSLTVIAGQSFNFLKKFTFHPYTLHLIQELEDDGPYWQGQF